MSTEEQNITREPVTPAQQVRADWRKLGEKLSYKAIVSNIPFICFVAVLCVFYIGNSHHAVEIQRDMNAQTKELRELKWRYTDVQSQLIQARAEAAVMKKAQESGLQPAVMPAYKITMK
ncbi:MAG: hypothetical protein H7257_01455 [Taibaiella sp.]|nr:hypothetical protein [Taibaiella sp.]